MRDAVIVEAIRTPVGRRNGMLRDWHPVDLLGYTLAELVRRAGIDAAAIDDVIAGCVTQAGEQSLNVARNAVLAAGFPESVPGTTVDRQCGSSQQAAHFAAQGVMAGSYSLVVACGVEAMTRVPMGSASDHGPGKPFGGRMVARYDDGLIHQGISAERIAARWNIERAKLDEFSYNSHQRAAAATADGRFSAEIVPLPDSDTPGLPPTRCQDEGIRADTSLTKLGTLRTAFIDDGRVTAGNSSQISDGAAALLIADRETAERLGLRPRARFVSFAVAADDPILMLTAPIPATAMVLKRAGLKLQDIDRIEINEAFASVVLAWQHETGANLDRVNVNGGAIALGHPLGASGARVMTTLIHSMEQSGSRYGLQTMCEGGGMANATIIERLD